MNTLYTVSSDGHHYKLNSATLTVPTTTQWGVEGLDSFLHTFIRTGIICSDKGGRGTYLCDKRHQLLSIHDNRQSNQGGLFSRI